jgi:hypothetical protein
VQCIDVADVASHLAVQQSYNAGCAGTCAGHPAMLCLEFF